MSSDVAESINQQLIAGHFGHVGLHQLHTKLVVVVTENVIVADWRFHSIALILGGLRPYVTAQFSCFFVNESSSAKIVEHENWPYTHSAIQSCACGGRHMVQLGATFDTYSFLPYFGKASADEKLIDL